MESHERGDTAFSPGTPLTCLDEDRHAMVTRSVANDAVVIQMSQEWAGCKEFAGYTHLNLQGTEATATRIGIKLP